MTSSNATSDRRNQTLAALGQLAVNPGPITEVLQAPEGDPDALIAVLQRCPVLAARVIGVANSAGSSALHRMESVERCVRHLGAKQARTIALTLAMQLLVQNMEVDEELMGALWGSASFKAVAARIVAESAAPQQVGSAYSVGLLQDIALPMLMAMDPDFFNGTLAKADGTKAWTELERERFGIDHAELGALLLQKWNAPATLIEQVRRHHQHPNDQDISWMTTLPGLFAGLLPHLEESTTPDQARLFAAVHARFLADAYPKAEAFIEEARRQVKALGKASGGPVKCGPEFLQRIVTEVASDTFALVAQVTQLDRQLGQQAGSLASAQEEAVSDPLTGLLNRRGFDRFGQQVLADTARAGLPCACVMVDLDDFKPINDTYGHDAGDIILKTTAELLKSHVASGDLVARMGGDEFAILLVGAPQNDTLARLQRIHAHCNGREIPVGEGEKASLHLSIGGLFIPRCSAKLSMQVLLDAADQLMYRCKQKGKSGMEFQALKVAA
ncbi:MAG: diguanylate cyclase [Planctomycetota bacterium]